MTTRALEIAQGLRSVQEEIHSDTTLIVVTKTFPISDLEILYSLGVRDFGENRIEELEVKAAALPDDVRWHYLGQIQGKKIARIARHADVIHSLDSLEHAEKFTQFDSLEYFLQINLEPSRTDRGGVAPGEVASFLQNSPIHIHGLMVVLPLNLDPDEGFESMRVLRKELINKGFSEITSLSMGMSGDFKIALRHGATHIRVGSSILGSR